MDRHESRSPNRVIADADVVICYERRGELVHFATQGLTNHELRTVIVGLWLRLTPADRAGMLAELRHYLQPGSQPAPLSLAIATGVKVDDR